MDQELYGAEEGQEIIDNSENMAEVADPQTGEPESAEESGNNQDIAEPEKPVQSAEDNARYAAIRRQAEAEYRAKYEREKESLYQNMGLYNPFAGKMIQSEADYREFVEQNAEYQRQQAMEQSGMTAEEYESFVSSLPEVVRARQEAERLRIQREAEREAQAAAEIDNQIKEIGKLDPSIKDITDLQSMENYDNFYDMVKRGYSLVDAYKLANLEKITAGNAVAERQRALNAANSKNHLNATKAGGKGTVPVPADVMRMYRGINPDATIEEIEKHYNATLNQ